MASSLDVCSVCTLALSVLLSLKLKFVKVTKHHTGCNILPGSYFVIIMFFFFLLLFFPSVYVRVEGKESVDIIGFLLT